jgi:sarcosine oxidase subunit beta
LFPRKAEVVVIGGGVIGSSIAYYLARDNIDVVLVEMDGIASGTSGANSGGVLLGSKKPGINLKLALESAKEYGKLIKNLEFDIEYQQNGGMIVIENENELHTMEVFIMQQKKAGLKVDLLDNKETRKMEPALSEGILGSTYSYLDAQLNSIYLNFSLVKTAQKFGAKVYTNTRVIDIKVKSGKIKSVITDKGSIETRIVINAAGSYASKIGALLGLNIPIKPMRGQIIVTEEIPPLLNRIILSAKAIVAKFNPYFSEDSENVSEFEKFNIGATIEQTLNGNVLVGTTREFAGFDKRINYKANKYIANEVCRIVPSLKEVNTIRTFAGLRPSTPDKLPILGKVANIEGFIMAAGHEGDGIALAPITGRLISELIIKGKSSMSLVEFRLERFFSK